MLHSRIEIVHLARTGFPTVYTSARETWVCVKSCCIRDGIIIQLLFFFFLNKRKVIQFAYTYIHIYTCTNKEPIFRLASRSYTVCQLKLNILNKNIERSAILINKANVLLACLNDIFCFVCDVFLNYIHLQIRINDSFPWHAAVLVEYEEWKGYVLDVCDYSCVYNMCCNKK